MDKNSAPQNPVERAIAIAGSEALLAAAIGCTQPAINKAKKADRVSADMALDLHHFSKGTIPAWETRPDLWTENSVLPERKTAVAEAS